MNKLNRFIKDLDDEAFYARCAAAIQDAIDANNTPPTLAIDLDWWKKGLGEFAKNDMLFNPRTGLLAKRISAILDKLETKFANPGLKFSANDVGVVCRIKTAAAVTTLNKSK